MKYSNWKKTWIIYMNWMNCNRYLFKYSNKIKILNIQIEKILNIQIKIEKNE